MIAVYVWLYDHNRKTLNFCGPIFFREPAHEKHATFFMGFEADEKDCVFLWATKKANEIFFSWAMIRPTKKMEAGAVS